MFSFNIKFLVLLVFLSFSLAATFPDLYNEQTNPAIRWARIHFELVRSYEYNLSPPMTCRAFAVYQTAIYDAWSFYDSKALPTIQYNFSKRKGSYDDIVTTISVTAWESLNYIYKDFPVGSQVRTKADQLLFDLTGLRNPTDMNPSTPVGLGKAVAKQLLSYSDLDGSNCLGDTPFSYALPNGQTHYQDYTNYSPINPPLITTSKTTREDCAKLDINKWQPLTVPRFLNLTGSLTQRFASPHMSQVRAFGLKCPSQLRPRGPPVFGRQPGNRISFEDQHNQVLQISATLGDREKLIAEFWAPTPEFGNPPNMFLHFGINALIVSRTNLQESIKFFFIFANAQLDAGIVAWDAKRHFDNSRPITAIRCMHTGEQIESWAGPYLGVRTIDGGEWIPYQLVNFVTPPFSEYVSGHSTFSMAGAAVFSRFFGKNWVGPNNITFFEGESTYEPKITNPAHPLYVAGLTDIPNEGPKTPGYVPGRTPVTLSWETWEDAAKQAGISRLYGGIHITDGNTDGQTMGNRVGELVWEKAHALFDAKFSYEECNQYFLNASGADTLLPTTITMYLYLMLSPILLFVL